MCPTTVGEDEGREKRVRRRDEGARRSNESKNACVKEDSTASCSRNGGPSSHRVDESKISDTGLVLVPTHTGENDYSALLNMLPKTMVSGAKYMELKR